MICILYHYIGILPGYYEYHPGCIANARTTMSHTSLCRWEGIESGEEGEAFLKVDQVPCGCSCKSSSVYCAAVGLHCSHNRGLMRMLLINRCCVRMFMAVCVLHQHNGANHVHLISMLWDNKELTTMSMNMQMNTAFLPLHCSKCSLHSYMHTWLH